ncbi:MAG: glycosyltransferase family 4 protein [Betaproteobacteria bacterium]
MSADIVLLSRYEDQGASSRVRSYQYLPALEAAGLRVERRAMFANRYVAARHRDRGATVSASIAGYVRRARQLTGLPRNAVLWIEYELLPWLPFGVERAFYASRRPVVVDYDDAVFHRYGLHRSARVRHWLGDKIERIMRAATIVVAGNDYLAQHARAAGARHVEVLPSVVDLARYRQKQEFDASAFTVGWIGSPSTTPFLKAIEPALHDARDIPGLSLRIVGGAPWTPANIAVTAVPWSGDTEVDAMQSFDVGVMPLPDDPWARGKCGYKLIQYMGCALPVIASPVGANATIVEHGRTGFLASSQAEWSEALRALAGSPALRRTMGAAGFDKARREYDLAVTEPRLVALFTKLVGAVRRG